MFARLNLVLWLFALSVEAVEHDPIPILLRRCTICHGGEYQDAGLDLRTIGSIRKGSTNGPVIIAEDPEKSLLIQKIVRDEMPPEADRGRAGIEVMPADELAALKAWIADGAKEPVRELVETKETREVLWSQESVRRPDVPEASNAKLVSNLIDAFLLRKLEAKGLVFSAPAEPQALVRRLAFGATGLPPEIEEDLPHDKLVDELLASRRYGERWGRFWLDLAGYADSEGKRQADMIRKFAWKYRDYVIRSFNEDKPYDQFLKEQIAGDELADYEDGEITREIFDNLVATGFLRMAPDGTTANPVNRVRDRIDVIADQLDILARGVMGLTMDCARCHDHKYDPLTQRDYYRLAAIFKGAYDEYDWLTPQQFANQWKKVKYRQLPVALPEEKEAWNNAVKDHEAKLKKMEDKLAKLDKKKTTEIRNLKKEINKFKGTKPQEPMIRALWDRGRPSATYVYKRGDHLLADEPVDPGVPVAFQRGIEFAVNKPWPAAKQTGRRLAFAKWLTDKRNPLTARVMVNRIWKHHFGRGLVESLDNFGKMGTPPSHPELLDWLAAEFMDNGWSIKHIHRLILNSTAWRQSSVVTEEARRLDPENRLLSRMPMQRLDAEQVHDSLLAIAGVLDETPFGAPDQVTVRGDGLVTVNAKDGKWRRSVYVRQRRKEMPTMLETFDLPQMNPNCIERIDSTVVTQPLHLLNNASVHELAKQFAERVKKEAGEQREQQVKRAFELAVNRPPTSREHELSLAMLHRMELGDFCHTLLNSAAFLYLD